MDKIYFPVEKTVFLPREKAPIGKMERVTTKAKVDAVEPAQTGWLCYGKLFIDLEYTPVGTGREKHPEHWKQVSQQMMAMGKEAKEICSIVVDFIQELPDRDFTYGCEFDADVQKKTWQQIASNALEIGVDIALSVREHQKKAVKNNASAEEHYMVLEQDSFSLEEKPADASRTKKATAEEPEELYYYAAEEGCDMITLESDEDTIAFCPAETAKQEEKTDCCGSPVDLDRKELCPTGEGAGSKGQHLYEKKETKSAGEKTDCREEMALEGDMVFTADCPTTEAKSDKEKKETKTKKKAEEKENCAMDCCESAPCLSETEAGAAGQQDAVPVLAVPRDEATQEEKPAAVIVEEEICVNEEVVLDATPTGAEEDGNDNCEVVPLPLPGKEKHRFWKGKKDKKDDAGKDEETTGMMNPFAAPMEKPAEPKKGYRLKFYVVQGGEDLAAIAEKHGVSPDSILAANKNIGEEDIRTGMVLSIPM